MEVTYSKFTKKNVEIPFVQTVSKALRNFLCVCCLESQSTKNICILYTYELDFEVADNNYLFSHFY